MHLPIFELNDVYHIGTLNPDDLGRNSGSGSLEGHCLSVSLCPHAWMKIARLGGSDLHKLSKTEGKFLDVIGITSNPSLHTAMVDWAVGENFAKRATVYRAWIFDEEAEDWSYLTAKTREDAIREINLDDDEDFDPDADGPDGHRLVEPVEIVSGTEALWSVAGARLKPWDDAIDLVVIAYASKRAPEVIGHPLDGVWWDEAYDPDMLSAPRGGILPERLAAWSSERCSIETVEDAVANLDEKRSIDP